jgi:predicted glycosyltransferase involved in capsule biosynthesis
MISIIVPFRANDLDKGYREYNCAYVLRHFEENFPDAEIIIGEDTSGNEYFCRSHAINDGVKGSSGNILIISDADIIISPQNINKALTKIKDSPFIIPFGKIGDLNRQFSEKIVKRNFLARIQELKRGMTTSRDISEYKIAGGIQIITRRLFNKVKGYDERFKGWGWEDTAFCWKIRREIGDYDVLTSEWIYHLWHPRPIPSFDNCDLATKIKNEWGIKDERHDRLSRE